METYQSRVLSKRYETDTVIFVDLAKPDSFSFEPGQYVSLEISQDGKTRYKPYSVYSHPSSEQLKLCLKLIDGGFASTYFDHVSPGEELTVRGPLGVFTVDEACNDHVFLATGVGIAPFNAMIRELLHEEHSVDLFHGVQRQDDLVKPETFTTLEDDHSSFSYHPVLSREKTGYAHGYVQDHTPIREDAAYYLCGVQEFVEETQSFLKQSGVSEALINTERFS